MGKTQYIFHLVSHEFSSQGSYKDGRNNQALPRLATQLHACMLYIASLRALFYFYFSHVYNIHTLLLPVFSMRKNEGEILFSTLFLLLLLRWVDRQMKGYSAYRTITKQMMINLTFISARGFLKSLFLVSFYTHSFKRIKTF